MSNNNGKMAKDVNDLGSKNTEGNSAKIEKEHFSKAVNVKVAGVPGGESTPNDTKPIPKEEITKPEKLLNNLSEKEKSVNKIDSHIEGSQALTSKPSGKY